MKNDRGWLPGAREVDWIEDLATPPIGALLAIEEAAAPDRIPIVDRDSGRVPVPWWFPYGPLDAEAFRGALGVLYGDGVGARAQAAWRHRRGLAHLARRYLSGR